MKSVRLLFILICLVTFITACGHEEGTDRPLRCPGVIDMRGWSPSDNGIINLDNEWEFYWQRFIEPDGFGKNLQPEYINVPGVWNGRLEGAQKISGDGYATYRLMLRNLEPGNYALKIPALATAYRLWVNEIPVASNGMVASDSSMIPQQRPTIAFFRVGGGDTQLTLHVSNFRSDKGGVWESIYFGTPERITAKREFSLACELALFGSIFIMALYHFSLYIFRRKNSFTLYFGIVCLLVAVRIIFTGEFFIISIFPDFSWEMELKIEFLSLYFAFTAFIMFIHSLFPQEVPGKPVMLFRYICYLFSAVTVMTGVKFYAKLMPLYHAIIMAGLIFVLWALVKGVSRGRNGSVQVLSGCVLLILTVVNDILDANGIIHTGYLLPYGLFLFIFVQSVVLSRLFSESFSRVEALSEELGVSYRRIEEYNRGLEAKIRERTCELENANEKLRALDRVKSDFIANVSHELRTPLTLILNPLDLIQKGTYGVSIESNHSIFGIMKRSGESLKRLINALLDLSKIDAGKLKPRPELFNIADCVKGVVVSFESMASSGGVALLFEEKTGGRKGIADPGLLETVVYNLMSNAMKFTPRGGSVTVSVDSSGSGFSVSVRDTGIGIAGENLERIFERFTQLDSSSSRKYEGTGIGLAIVREIADITGGSVSVESREGEGSCFTYSFPNEIPVPAGRAALLPGEPAHEDAPLLSHTCIPADVSADGPGIPEDLAILVVEDNDDMRSFISGMLRENYALYTAADGLEAVEILKTVEPVDLILSDIMMPGMDGYELLRWTRGNERYSDVPFIFLTAKSGSGMMLDGLRLGAVDYITKPFDSEELMIRIKNQALLKRCRNMLRISNEKLLQKLNPAGMKKVNVSGEMEARIDNICAFIKENYNEIITRELLADAVGMNPDTFSRMFNAHVGMGLVDYINICRVDEASKRLFGTTDTVTRISIETGFDSIRTFNRVFKKIKGMSPVEYREVARLKN